jgi:mannose-6-phosphate isomerase-like protein (cupin superfamily)
MAIAEPLRVPKPLIVRPGEEPVAASGGTLVIREWTMPGPSYLHVHRSDDEGWHVLEGMLRFHTADGDFDAAPGTTVFIPAGTPHSYSCPVPSRYLIFLTPSMDRLIAKLIALTDDALIPATLAEHDTEIVGWVR